MVDALLELISFVEPARPGVVAIYPQFALPAQITTTKAVFERLQKEHQPLKSIKYACFQMLDENFSNQFKVSNIPTLMIGWNASMKIQDIFDQLDRPIYGKTDTMHHDAPHQRNTFSEVRSTQQTSPSRSSTEESSTRRSKSSQVTRTPTHKSSTMLSKC
jgi:hypothetical protein